ncbi:2-amino-4-hydroxy-6-hydroxymethyldihydropteridine diphosphokinase [Wenzhouxiangella sp. XN24]|uniref:2-amino-4-hydroxy-6- hydroxymethyldihydropteridine diphosphokinase n=1 Tax=Wenzhouxiangella sp. XN24 TaxID=2713569 RepID=UPI0013EA4943|nr:2-amino-4-hydroxy-6-hydroxymethyldihydropteridine diphosphokinase [Wenzhouxiangella sp. XN24]NGX16115.1 2-amino-4-hydroxy-6-hydroxymethyldihydropteridine diphosphokinase [Wenzhouxiangella sp. XN24]
MPEVYIGAGSNVEPRRHLGLGLRALAERFGVLRLSPVYRNSPVGFSGEDFLNLVIAFETEDDVHEVVAALGAIEAAHGRVRGEEKFAPRTLDLDLLLYGDLVIDEHGVQLPRDEITRYPFVLRPLADLAGDRIHPVLGRSFSELWGTYDGARHPLTRVEGDFAAEVAL